MFEPVVLRKRYIPQKKALNQGKNSSFEIENFSTLRDIKSILLRMVLLYSKGRGSLFESATPTFMTNSKSYFLGFLNKVLFVSEPCLVPE